MTDFITDAPFYMRVTYSEVKHDDVLGPIIEVTVIGENLDAVNAKIAKIKITPTERDELGNLPNGNDCSFTKPVMVSCRYAGKPTDYWYSHGYYTVNDSNYEPPDPPGWEGGFADNH